MKIAGLIQDSIVDGPGIRFVVFTQGCDIDCKGCHNPDAIDISGGTEMTVDEIISEMRSNPLTDGLTLSGGEPFMQAADCTLVAAAAHESGIDVWVYSGNSFEELINRAKSEPDVEALLNQTDILVDGRFILSERTLSARWRGSKNQRVIDVKSSLSAGTVTLWEPENYMGSI